MCYSCGSVDQAMNVCPMCKVHKPSSRCPHIRDVCRNRANHPRFDVLYMTNAEVQCFNGCGYCKWAASNPPTKSSGYMNPGWPGCCRPPTGGEYRMIQAADWPSVSVVHHIPIPADIKAILDSVPVKATLPSTGRLVNPPTTSTPLTSDRKANKPNLVCAKPPAPSTPPRTRPQLLPSQTSSSLDIPRRADKRAEPTHNSPNRQNLELESSTPRRKSDVKQPASTTTTPNALKAQPHSRKPSSSSSPSMSPPNKGPVPGQKSAAPQACLSVTSRTRLEEPPSPGSSSSGSDGLSSMTDSTLTSDGGFTDYLSDESEAELQRQAEAKAALFAQIQMEELEFKSARQQLTHVDLRPPKNWNPSSSPRAAYPNLARSQEI